MSSRRVDNPSKRTLSKVQIMPLLRKSSRNGSSSASIDPSRSSFEQEGLEIYSGNENDCVESHVFGNFPTRKKLSDLHRRSTSGNSQISTASSSSQSKPGSQYIHPMRLAPRAFTPPLSHSCQGSFFESDGSTKGETTEGDQVQSGSDPIDLSTRVSSGQSPRLSLQIQSNSFTRLPGASQTNITGRSSFGYSRENGSTLDTASPVSRTSLDFVFRSKTRASMDPVSRAATVQAARQAFEEKEAAKTRKFEEQQMKAEEKQMKRREKQDLRSSPREDDIRVRETEKDSFKNEKMRESPRLSPSGSQSGPYPEDWESQSRNSWMLFLTWLRTRIFKFRRRIRRLS